MRQNLFEKFFHYGGPIGNFLPRFSRQNGSRCMAMQFVKIQVNPILNEVF